MTLHLDTSLLVAVLTNEASTERVRSWMKEQPFDQIAISDWVEAEFSAALSIKVRMGVLQPMHRNGVLGQLTEMVSRGLTALPVTRDRFREAARFANEYSLGLRAGDALHLAICADYGAMLCTLVRRLAAAGPVLGVGTTLV